MSPDPQSVLVQLMDHIIEGYDIPSPAGVIRISPSTACEPITCIPYTFGCNLAHAVMWQNFWLVKLKGGRKSSSMTEWSQDFREPELNEIPKLKSTFLEGLREARSIAAQVGSGALAVSDAEATETLLRIAVHASYHLGQMNLIKRSARNAKP